MKRLIRPSELRSREHLEQKRFCCEVRGCLLVIEIKFDLMQEFREECRLSQ
jgi:hypothetical protein